MIYDTLLKYKGKNIVLDPVMISTNGKSLIKMKPKIFQVNKLFKSVNIITPNLDETKK